VGSSRRGRAAPVVVGFGVTAIALLICAALLLLRRERLPAELLGKSPAAVAAADEDTGDVTDTNPAAAAGPIETNAGALPAFVFSGLHPNPNWSLLNKNQRLMAQSTVRQFRTYLDGRTFDGWTAGDLAALERRLRDALNGPHNAEYYEAINSLAVLRSTNAVPALREIAFDRGNRNNRDRWMAARALGIIGDRSVVPDLIHLLYHRNLNTRWWAQISLVLLTGENFGKDWNAWGNWWNSRGGRPAFDPNLIRWWSGQAEPDKLARSFEGSDRHFFQNLSKQAKE
jgi:hypothetical protein